MNARAVTTDVLLGLLPIALLIAGWQALVSFGYAPVTLLPPPGQVFGRMVQQILDPTFQQDIVATLIRLFAGFAIAVVLGVAIGLAAAANPAINAVVRPIVRVLAPLPKVALYPALLLLLGFNHESKIVLVAADALFPILSVDLLRCFDCGAEVDLVGDGRGNITSRNHVQGGAAGGRAVDPDRMPDRPRDFLHRGVSGGDDHLD